jgi:WD40 repeat protein
MGLSLLPIAAALEPDVQIERIGTMIGRYRLLEQIGEGGFGVVYMSEQQEPVQRKVALKIIKPGMDTKEVIARFEAERQALALMDHPNIARVLDAGTTAAGRPYFVMELVRGIPLTDYCDQSGLPLRERLRLFIKVCQAVQHAHQKGVIHRDIKPSNVLVTLHDGEPVPKVIDFGVAKALGQKLTEKTVFTGFQHMIGTPAYMSPEQAALSGLDIDTRADIYSLGVLAYELLTGVTPFDAEAFRRAAVGEIQRLIRETEPLKPSTRLQSLGEKLTEVARQRRTEPGALSRLLRGDLDWIVMRCLEKDRQRRYATASGLAADVTRHLNNEPVVARPPGKVYRFQKLVRRHKLVFVAAGAVAVSLVIGLCVSTWLFFRETAAYRQVAIAESEQNRLLRRAEANEAEAMRERDRANQALALLRLQRAEDLFAANQTSTALAYVAGVLRQNLTNETVAARVFANLTRHVLIIPLAKPLVHAGYVYYAQFSPDGLRVVTASADGTARVWNASTGEPITPKLQHHGPVWFAQFSPDGGRVVTASEDKTAMVWDATTGANLTPPMEHPCSVGFVYFSPDGERLVSGTWEPDWETRLWNARTGQLLGPPITDVHRLRCAPFNRDGDQLVTTWHTNSAMIWNGYTAAPLLGPFQHDQHVWAVEFSPDGRRILTACNDGSVRIWEARTNEVPTDLTIHLPTATARIQDIRPALRPIHTIPHGKPLWLARFSPDGSRVFTICNDMTVQVWSAETGRALSAPLNYANEADLEGYAEQIGPYRKERSAMFSPNGQMVVMAFGGRPLLLDANEARIVTEPINHATVRSAEFSPDGQRIVTASSNGTARIWGILAGWQGSADFLDTMRVSPVPEWVPSLMEAIAEKCLNPEGDVESVTPSKLPAPTRRLAENTASDPWTAWAKWLILKPEFQK